MKNIRTSVLAPLTFVSAAFLAGNFSAGAAPTQDSQDLAARVGVLEKRVATLESKKGTENDLLDETIAYLANQAKAGESLTASIAQAEALGFTKGINYESREVLANGLRAFCTAKQSGLPEVAPKAKDASDKKAVGR